MNNGFVSVHGFLNTKHCGSFDPVLNKVKVNHGHDLKSSVGSTFEMLYTKAMDG